MAPPLPEWSPHEAVWIGFPSDPELWLGDLKPAEREVAAFAGAVHAGGKGEQVWLVAAHEDAAKKARQLAPFATVVVEKFGDIWLRDSGPIVMGSGKQRRAQGVRFNGWGNKYDLEGDQDVGERIAKAATSFSASFRSESHSSGSDGKPIQTASCGAHSGRGGKVIARA